MFVCDKSFIISVVYSLEDLENWFLHTYKLYDYSVMLYCPLKNFCKWPNVFPTIKVKIQWSTSSLSNDELKIHFHTVNILKRYFTCSLYTYKLLWFKVSSNFETQVVLLFYQLWYVSNEAMSFEPPLSSTFVAWYNVKYINELNCITFYSSGTLKTKRDCSPCKSIVSNFGAEYLGPNLLLKRFCVEFFSAFIMFRTRPKSSLRH